MMKTILKWIAGVLFGMATLAAFALKAYASVPFYFLASVICIPPALDYLQVLMKTNIPRWAKYSLLFAGWAFGGASWPSTKPLPPISQSPNQVITTVHDTIFAHDTVLSISVPMKALKKESTNKRKVSKKTISDDTFFESLPDGYVGTGEEFRKPSKKSKRRSSSKSEYITGPRGGCYYINGNGKKVYVDHSYCQ